MPAQKKSFFSFPFLGQVWKVLTDAQRPVIVLEIRNGETREVEFAAVNVQTGKMLWKGNPVHDKWWPSLKQVVDGLVVLQGFKEGQQPEPKGIWILDVNDGKNLWKNESAVFLSGDSREFILQLQEEEKKYQKADAHTGIITGDLQERLYLPIEAESGRNLLCSGHYTQDNPYFPRLAEFVRFLAKTDPVQAIEYLEVNNYIIISFYIYHNGKLANELLVSDQEGQILFRELIGEELSGIGLETFFVFNNRLVFIKDKKELLIYEL